MASKFPALLENLSAKYGYILMEHTPRGMTKSVYQILDKQSGVVLAQVEPISSRYNIHKGMKWSVNDFVKYYNFKTMNDVVAFLDEKFAKQRGGKLSKTDSGSEPKGIGSMTLNEYINQKNPRRFVSVDLKKSEVRALPWVSYGGEQIREVYVNKFPQSTYIQIWGDPVLYTSDSQGNPQKISVFRLNDFTDNLKGIGGAYPKDWKPKIYYKYYGVALDDVHAYVSQKYDVDIDDFFSQLSSGGKPARGRTKKGIIRLRSKETGKELKKTLSVQVYRMDNDTYELNWYVS